MAGLRGQRRRMERTSVPLEQRRHVPVHRSQHDADRLGRQHRGRHERQSRARRDLRHRSVSVRRHLAALQQGQEQQRHCAVLQDRRHDRRDQGPLRSDGHHRFRRVRRHPVDRGAWQSGQQRKRSRIHLDRALSRQGQGQAGRARQEHVHRALGVRHGLLFVVEPDRRVQRGRHRLRLWLLDGATGRKLGQSAPTDSNFEASPAVYGNILVLGCRGDQTIFGMRLS